MYFLLKKNSSASYYAYLKIRRGSYRLMKQIAGILFIYFFFSYIFLLYILSKFTLVNLISVACQRGISVPTQSTGKNNKPVSSPRLQNFRFLELFNLSLYPFFLSVHSTSNSNFRKAALFFNRHSHFLSIFNYTFFYNQYFWILVDLKLLWIFVEIKILFI